MNSSFVALNRSQAPEAWVTKVALIPASQVVSAPAVQVVALVLNSSGKSRAAWKQGVSSRRAWPCALGRYAQSNSAGRSRWRKVGSERMVARLG